MAIDNKSPFHSKQDLRVAQRLQSWIPPAAADAMPGAMAVMVLDFLNRLYR